MQTETIISLVIYMIAMLVIGYYSFKNTSDLSDYMLGGRGRTYGNGIISWSL